MLAIQQGDNLHDMSKPIFWDDDDDGLVFTSLSTLLNLHRDNGRMIMKG